MAENKVIYEGLLNKGFGLMPKLVATDTNLTIEAKAIYGYIASFAGNGESAFPKVKTMLYHLQISEKRYYKHMQLLIDYGYIEIQKRRRYDKDLKKWVADSNLYIIKQVIEKKHDNDNVATYDNNTKNVNDNNKTNNVESIENTTFAETSHFDSVQNESVQNESIQNYGNINNNSNTINNINNNNSVSNSKLVVVDKEKQVIELYKSFKLEKRFMPQAKKLLQEYADKFDLDVFKEIFISASSDSVSKKYAYIKKVFETLAAKNIKTLEDYQSDQEAYKQSKENKKAKNNNKSNKVVTKFHNINTHCDKYSENELEDLVKGSQVSRGIINQDINAKLYKTACEIGMDSLSSDAMRSLVIDYALAHNLDIPN